MIYVEAVLGSCIWFKVCQRLMKLTRTFAVMLLLIDVCDKQYYNCISYHHILAGICFKACINSYNFGQIIVEVVCGLGANDECWCCVLPVDPMELGLEAPNLLPA